MTHPTERFQRGEERAALPYCHVSIGELSIPEPEEDAPKEPQEEESDD